MEERIIPKELKAIPGGYSAGCIVELPVMTEIGVVRHKGILSDKRGPDGIPMVIHAAKLRGQGIVEVPVQLFFEKARGPLRSMGFPGLYSPAVVLERARSQIGKPWKLWNNCEHFAAWCHDMPKKSPELRRKALGAVAVGAGLFVLAKGTV